MHKLTREVRFSINPFSAEDVEGFNSYASSPCGDGLALYFGLWVGLSGEVDRDTGFIVNVGDIDRAVRRFVVPIFAERIRKRFGRRQEVEVSEIFEILKRAWGALSDKFGAARLSKLCLELNPFRKVAIESEDGGMVYFSEKFEFAAMHTLWNDEFSRERNFEVFGKCANPAGHGHNYVVEVTVGKAGSEGGFSIGEFERIVDDEFIKIVDHKNLNVDVAEFAATNPTVENIAGFAWERLSGKFGSAELSSVTVWENDRTYCVYAG